MVFSTETLLESKNLSSTPFSKEEDYDISFFDEALNMILEEDKQFYALMHEYTKEFLNEGISFDVNRNGISFRSGLNIGSLFEKILEWFINAVENLVSNFKIFLSKFLNSGARLTAFKSKLANFRGSVHYGKLYYEYRNLDMDTSYAAYGDDLEKEYRLLMSSLSQLREASTQIDLAEIIDDLYQDSQYDESEMNRLRARALGLHGEVTKDEYADEIFKYFRYDTIPIDPNVKKYEKNIDGNRVHEAYVSYFSSRNQERVIERDKAKLKSEAEKQKRMIRGTTLKDFLRPGLEPNVTTMNSFHSVIIQKCKTVKEICDIYSLLFSGKLMALKDYNMMNRQILLAAIEEIIRQGDK